MLMFIVITMGLIFLNTTLDIVLGNAASLADQVSLLFLSAYALLATLGEIERTPR